MTNEPDAHTTTELGSERLRELLPAESIYLNAAASSREDAVRQAGEALVRAGATGPGYVDSMLERERTVSTFVGEGVALPHGTLSAKDDVRADALVLLRFAETIEWGGESVSVVVGVAAHGRHYIALISQIASVLLTPSRAEALRSAATVKDVYAVFG